jgi:hypothetical protein
MQLGWEKRRPTVEKEKKGEVGRERIWAAG